MKWVLSILKRRLRDEKHYLSSHGKLRQAGPEYAISAKLAEDRIPQLEKAIEILKQSQ